MGAFDTLVFGYRTIRQGLASVLSRSVLSFQGSGVTVTDDPLNQQTIVNIGGTVGPQGPPGNNGPAGPQGLPGGGIQQLVTKSANYTVDAGGGTDTEIWCNTSGAGFTVTLPSPTANRPALFLVDSTGSFATNNLTLARHGGENINGLASNKVLSAQWGEYRITTDGTNWIVRGF